MSQPRRIPELDAIRGFALLGIVVANVMWFSGFAVASPEARAAFSCPLADRLTETLLHIFVDGKFYCLFSLLFGAGFVLTQRSTFARRLPGLFAIGLAHGVLLWFGDIVSLYAVAGIALLGVGPWSATRLLRVGVACLAAPVVLGGAWLLADTWWSLSSGSGYGPATLLPAFAEGSYADAMRANAAFLTDRWYLALVSHRFPRIVGMFLLGAAAMRSGILQRPPALRAIVRALWPFCAVASLAVALLGGVPPPRPPTLVGWLADILYSVAAPTGAAVYAAAIAILVRERPRLATWLGSAGRLSLTNYIAQSAVMVLLFYGYAGGAWGSVGATAAVAIAVAIYVAQAGLSRAWLRRFARGPLESVLRGTTRSRARPTSD